MSVEMTIGTMRRRHFLRATGVSAGIGGLYVAGSTTGRAYHTQTDAADRFVAADSSNYSASNRGADDIDWIVVHVTVGSYSGAVSWFQNPDANVSAHYVVSNYDHTDFEPGHVTQMVHHEDVAWHASGSNSPSIGIEHEWHEDYGRYVTDECYEASAAIVREVADRYGIPLEYYTDHTAPCSEPGGIIEHRHAPADGSCSESNATACPGPDWDGDRFMQFVRDGDGGDGGYAFEMDDGAMTTVDLNGREGPGLDYDVVETLPEGEVGRIVNGPEDADGYRWWGLHFSKQDVWVWCVERYLERVAFYVDEEVYATVDLNVREGPGLHHDVSETIPAGTVAEVVNGPEDADGYRWWGLHVPDYGLWGWAVERYLESNE